MPNLVLVLLGGALGAGARYEFGKAMFRLLGPAFPWGTLIVNLAGGMGMGLLAGWFIRHGGGSEAMRSFVGVGLLGGFTTFSAFSLDIVMLAQRGALVQASAYLLASVFGSLLMLCFGLWLMRVAL